MAWPMGPYFDSSLSNNCMAMAMPESSDQSKETLLAMLNSYQLPGMQGMGVSGKVGKRAYSYGMLDGYYTDDSYDDKVVESRSSAGFGRHSHRIEKKRRLTAEQVRSLEASFESQNKLEPERKIKLAQQLGLQPRQVAVWFQNRRARWKTKELERIYDDLKDRYDAVTQEKEQLKTEVARLKGLLQCEKSVCTEQKEISEEEEGGDGDQSKHSVSDITEVLAGSFSPAMDSDDHHDSNNGSKVDEEDHQQSNSQFEECYGFEQDMAMYNYMLRNTFDESFNSFLWCTSDLPPNTL